MLRTTLRQARATVGRLVAAGVAVVLGTAFVAAVLLGGELIQRTAYDSVAAEYAGADVVVTPGGPLDDAVLDDVASAPGVAGAEGRTETVVELLAGGRTELGWVATAPGLSQLQSSAGVVEGELPSAAGGVALDGELAERLGLALGDELVVSYTTLDPAADPADPEGGFVDAEATVRVEALTRSSSATLGGPTVLAAPADLATWAGQGEADYARIVAVADEGTSETTAKDAVAQALSGTDAVVRTADEQSAAAIDELTGGTNQVLVAVLAFAAVAMFVAGVVITNTFSVLVAQRTRQLALLRCVGATASQVRRGVLTEAALLGLVSSVVGVLAGTALVAAAARILASARPDVPISTTTTPTLASVAVPLGVGLVVTVLAALAPARAATRVSPLAALRPPEALTGARVHWLRTATAVVLTAAGAAALVGGVVLSTSGSLGLGVGVAVLGGTVSFLGVLVGAVLVVPRLVGLVGRVAALPGGAPARLTAANVVRNPRRTSATTSALLIGVTLVTLMTVGAASMQATLSDRLDERYPVDVSVGTPPTYSQPVTSVDAVGEGASPPDPALVQTVSDVPGVDDTVPLTGSLVGATFGDRAVQVGARAVDPAAARSLVLAPVVVEPLRAGVVVVPEQLAMAYRVSPGDDVALTVDGRTTTLRAEVTPLPGQELLLTPDDLAAVAPDAPVVGWWLALAPGADALDVVADLRDAVTTASGSSGTSGPVEVEGAAAQRAAYAEVIDTLLLVVVALLGVAVVIALIGVANTLSLSVIERTRESAVLRALGLTRAQLRGMLALEGVLVAGVGAVLGLVLGTLYGWSGAAALLADAGGGSVALGVPWTRLGLVLAVAVLAGLLASVLPARRAARTSPVAALAE